MYRTARTPAKVGFFVDIFDTFIEIIFSRTFGTAIIHFWESFGNLRICFANTLTFPDVCGGFRRSSDVFGCVWVRLDAFGRVRKCS